VIPALPAPDPPVPAASSSEPVPLPPIELNKSSGAKATSRRAEPVEPVAPAPPRDGRVAFAISPWGEIFVNGISRGVSPPLTQLALPPGLHDIEIRNTAASPFTVRVEVRPGETIAVQHRF
jgi:hypothetical protein